MDVRQMDFESLTDLHYCFEIQPERSQPKTRLRKQKQTEQIFECRKVKTKSFGNAFSKLTMDQLRSIFLII